MKSDDDNPRGGLREQVESLLPSWQSWYPSLFEAAHDLGLIRARVCAPSMLMLSDRHAQVRSEALQAFKEHWCVEDEPAPNSEIPQGIQRHIRNSMRGTPTRGRSNKRR